MKTLDRYIIKQFLVNFFILLVVFMSLFVLGDFLSNSDEFTAAGKLFAERELEKGRDISNWVGTLFIMADFYLPLMALLYSFFSGLIIVTAAGFTYINLSRNGEIVAVIASGISVYQIAMPVLVVGSVLSFSSLANQQWVIPQYKTQLLRKHRELKHLDAPVYSVTLMADGNHTLFNAVGFEPSKGAGALKEPTIILRTPTGRATMRITASWGYWVEDDGNGVSGWELDQAHGEVLTTGDSLIDADDAGRFREVNFVASDLSPEILQARRASLYAALLSFEELQDLRSSSSLKPEDRNQVRQIMHSRFSMVVLNVIVLALGLPFFILREADNVLKPALKAAVICMVTWGGGLVAMQLPASVFNPETSAWLPIMPAIVLLAIVLAFGVKT